MAEKPILFSSEMVRAILDGRKTQTRRVIKPQPYFSNTATGGLSLAEVKDIEKKWLIEKRSPYQVGDLLWVRETWATWRNYDHLAPRDVPMDASLWWKADGSSYRDLNHSPGKWRPSIFMPRWASRITLRVVNVRVERVQDISEADAAAEGVEKFVPASQNLWKCYGHPGCKEQIHNNHWMTSATASFYSLWNSLNANRGYSWDSNPWVWVVEFEVTK